MPFAAIVKSINAKQSETLKNLQPLVASSVKLFNSLQWLRFYEEVKIAKGCVAYKRIEGEVPLYIEDFLRLNSQQHSRHQ